MHSLPPNYEQQKSSKESKEKGLDNGSSGMLPVYSTMTSVKSVKSVISLAAPDTVRPPNAGWDSQIEFILTCIAYAVGLGNVWRFPYLCFSNGGGAFVIPYCIMLVLIGLPIFFMELSFGQFASLGPLMIWTFNPLMKGLGFSMIAVTLVIALYYNVIIAQCLFYFWKSLASFYYGELPWMTCGNYWNTGECYIASTNPNSNRTQVADITANVTEAFQDGHFVGSNVSNVSSNIEICPGLNLAKETGENRMGYVGTSTEEFFYNLVLHKSPYGIDDWDWPEPEMALFLFITWAIVCAGLIKGVASLGKISYFTALFPYFMLIVLLIRGVTLPGAWQGIVFYFTPKWEFLVKPAVWQKAATMIFYNLSCATGGLMAMASFNKFRNNCLRDALLVPILNAATSVFAGLVVFAILGVMAAEKGVKVEDVVDGGPGLVFIAYPEALSKLPFPSVWAVLFFLMMLALGFGSELSLVETVLAALQDDWHDVLNTTTKKMIYRIGCCLLFFGIGLTMVTKNGIYILEVVDEFIAFICLIIICLVEVILIAWVYGFPEYRVCGDIELMLNREPPGFYKIMWRYITPLTLFGLIVASVVSYEPLKMNISEKCTPDLPNWALGMGWTIALFSLLFVPCWVIYYLTHLHSAHKNDPNVSNLNFKEIMTHLQPMVNWGPKDPEDRRGRYAHMTRMIEEANNFDAVDKLIEMQQSNNMVHKEHLVMDDGDFEARENLYPNKI